MASLRFENDRGRKGWRIRFRDSDKKQRSLWLGDLPEYAAIEFKAHVEHLLYVQKHRQTTEPPTIKWLTELDAAQHDRLANIGLVESRRKRELRQLTIEQWFSMYIEERRDVAHNTAKIYREVKQNLLDYFEAGRLLKDVSVADAKQFRVWLATRSNRRDKKRKTLAESTVRRRTGICKQFWKEAIDRGYVNENPFANLQSANKANPDRQFFVTHEMMDQCIEQAPCGDWRTIVALCRYGGMRCPSEVLGLKWSDVDLPGGKMMIDSPKTGLRVCPIFVELRPYLEAAWDNTEPGVDFVVNRYRSADQNLRTTFEKIIKSAGLVPWPRLFQNLRASRETELMATYPAKDVSSWIGNSVPVAMKHYAMATDETFRAAAGMSGGHIGGHIRGHIMGNQGNISSDQILPEHEKTPVKTGVLLSSDDYGLVDQCAREDSNLHGIISH